MPEREGKVHVGDLRTRFILTFHETIRDPDNQDQNISPILDISTMAEAEMKWTKPSGVQITRTHLTGVKLFTDGKDGKLEFLNDGANVFPIDEGDSDWAIEGFVKFIDDTLANCDKEYFLVRGENQ